MLVANGDLDALADGQQGRSGGMASGPAERLANRRWVESAGRASPRRSSCLCAGCRRRPVELRTVIATLRILRSSLRFLPLSRFTCSSYDFRRTSTFADHWPTQASARRALPGPSPSSPPHLPHLVIDRHFLPSQAVGAVPGTAESWTTEGERLQKEGGDEVDEAKAEQKGEATVNRVWGKAERCAGLPSSRSNA